MSADSRRLTLALLLSLLFHALLLSLTFGSQGLGLPGLQFPWRERRIEAPDLRAVLVPEPVGPSQPLQQAPVEHSVVDAVVPPPPAPVAPAPTRSAPVARTPKPSAPVARAAKPTAPVARASKPTAPA